MLKQVKWSSALGSVLVIAVGILMIWKPESFADIAKYVIGVGFMVFGLINIGAYFLLDVRDTLYRNDFVSGLMALMVGIALIMSKDLVSSLIPIILGLIIMTSGFAKLQRAIIAKRIGYTNVWIYVILALVSIVIGAAVIFFLNGNVITRVLFIVIGSGLIYCGASDLFANFFLASKFNQFVKDFETARKEAEGKVIEAETSNEQTVTDNSGSKQA